MLGDIGRRRFLLGASALGVAAVTTAATNATTNALLGHVKVGNGPEGVLVLHEWLGDHTVFDSITPFLTRDRYTYVFADLRGYGLSRAMTGDYSVKEAAIDALALMDSLGFEHFHVVGHSMSGMLAQYLMVVAPKRLATVVAVSPVPADGYHTDAAGLAKLEAVITDDDAARATIASRVGGRYNRAWLDYKLAITRRAAPEAMRGYLAMFTGTDFSVRVKGASTPISAIVGAHDVPFYRRSSVQTRLGAWFPQLQIAEVMDAGHYTMLETPILFATLVEQALAGGPVLGDVSSG